MAEKIASASARSTAPSEIGSRLANRYEVVRELGRGGMGVVYLCKDLVTGDRVALKRLRLSGEVAPAGEDRPEETWWFQQEARAIAALEHPTIVRARDFGSLSDGTPYLVMDVLPGRSVHEWMHTTGLSWPVVWSMVDQTLAGLAHAHARGVIHGDLKPSNIMVDLAAGLGPRAYLLDLGLAWVRQNRHDPRLDGGAAPEPLQHRGAGTVGWVAPEQIRKQATLVGPATDLYALGCVMYRLLSGKEVFEGEAQDVLRAHKRNEVPEPSLPDGVPAGVASFVQRLLEKLPWKRFEYAADARRAWRALRPTQGATLEEVASIAGPATSQHFPSFGAADDRLIAAARSLAPGLLALRSSPMIARDEERGELGQIVHELATKRGAPQRFVALVGEAGVGKSRLAEWLCEQVHEVGSMVALRARYGRMPTPLDGVTGAVNAYFNLEGADRVLVEQTLIARWEVAPDNDEELTWVAAIAEWLRPTPPGGETPLGPTGKRFVLDRPELRWIVVRRVLERIGRDRPVLLWLDDLHLASPNTFDMLHRLRRDAPQLRLFLLATARSEALLTDAEAGARLDATRADWNGQLVDVKPLGGDETETLLRTMLPLDDIAVARASEQSRGNPLFALQLLHAWAGGGYLQLESGQYRVPDRALHGRAITTAELWDERLLAVSSELRLSAYAAAALGEDIRGEVLKSLVSSLGLSPHDVLVALTGAQIILAVGNDQFRWPHALLQEHLLERLQDRGDATTIFRVAADALAKHPAVGSRRIMKHRVANLLRAGDDDAAAELMFQFIEGGWRRGRDTAATLADLELLDGHVRGHAAAQYSFWRAEALRHVGRLAEARSHAEKAKIAFESAGDTTKAAHALRLLGHIASDVGAPAQGRVQVALAVSRFEELGDLHGLVQAQLVLGEIDYLLGQHEIARTMLERAEPQCRELGDPLGRAQCLLLLALTEMAAGAHRRARGRIDEARVEFDAIGYRLGIAQCDVVLAHAEYRGGEIQRARARALGSRSAFRDVKNPRGEAACERLLAIIAFDTDDYAAAAAHAQIALRLYEGLRDPWGEVESRLVLVQVALAKGESTTAEQLIALCDAIPLDEAEPRQHRHLTHAWIAQRRGEWSRAAQEIDRARSAFGEKARCGDHAPLLLKRFSHMIWLGPALTKIDQWLMAIERSGRA